MVKGVIFDVDGVLLNSMPVWENLGELYLQKFGIQAEKDLSEILYEMSLKEAAEYLISHYGLKQTVEEVTKGIVKEVEQFYVEKVPLKEGVREYLKELKERKIPMVIATSGDRKNAEAALKRLKVFSYFEGIFTASEIGSGKNQPGNCISQRHFNWIQIRGRPGSLRMHGMQSERQRVRDLRRSQSMIRRTIKIWDKSGIMRIFICRIC